MDKKHIYLISLFSLLWVQTVSAEEVGQVQYTRGAVIMQNLDGSGARLIAKDETMQRGEVIKTGPASFTIVKLKDGTRMTIRPDSAFSVEKLNAKEDSTASAVLRLFRGGLRAISGYISKRNKADFKLHTSIATIGIRGTEFDMRLCQDDCEEENTRLKKTYDKQLNRTVARAVFVRGGLIAKTIDGAKRTLNAGSSIFEGDTLITTSNSYSIIAFRDRSRISLLPETVFRVDEMKFDEDNAEKTSALFSLLRGGLRAMTGLIGKLYPQKYKMRTSVATIDIYGTAYDLMCTGACMATDENQSEATVRLPEGDGLYAHVWDGSINFAGQVLASGTAAFKLSRSSAAVVLPTVPAFFKNNTVPKPGSVDVDEKTLFSKIEIEEAAPGLYVNVTEGSVIVENKIRRKVVLQAGQAGYADVLGRQLIKLAKTPAFQQYDAYPTPDVPNPGSINLNATMTGNDSGRVCEIK